LEVRRYGDGHPPVTRREREIRLNGTSGVKISVNARIEDFDSGIYVVAVALRRACFAPQSGYRYLKIRQ